MGDSSDSDVEENLGILQPTILQHIKEILREYRNDVQIIKELIQNADDAGASEMKILYQEKNINKEVEGETRFRKFLRAPALVFHNDSVFSEADWKGVRSIYTSEKAHDPLKIGRFGLGFKSIFHMTDFPTVLSGDKIMFINPSEKDQNKVCTTINLKNLKRSKNLKISDFLGVFENTMGFNKAHLQSGFFPATIFWFPLRQRASELSNTIYSKSEVIELLDSFIEESDRNILFAKTVSKIQVFIERPEIEELDEALNSHKGELNESKLYLHKTSFGKHTAVYAVEIDNETGNLIAERMELSKKLQTMKKTVPDTPEHWTFDALITRKKTISNGETKESRSRWLIVNYLKGGELSEQTQILMRDENLCFHHFVGIAAQIKDGNVEESYADTGRIFCYQPLPQENQTGLPVYINAMFALGNNRRQIKWEDKDSGKLTDKEIEWNHTLVSEILPPAYRLFFREMVNLSKRNDNAKHFVASVYSLIPDFQNTDDRWIELGMKFIEQTEKDEMFYTGTQFGGWLSAVETIILPEHEMFVDTIEELLNKDQLNFSIIPENVVASLAHITQRINWVSPQFLCKYLLKNASYKGLSSQQKEHLLRYIASSESSSYMNLNNLELLPLADGSFTYFSGSENDYLENSEVLELFDGMQSKFVSTTLRPETSDIIQKVANAGTYGIKPLDAESAAYMIKAILRENIGTGTILTLHVGKESKWKRWVESVWKFIHLRYNESISTFASLPMFPFRFTPNWETTDEIEVCSLSSLMMYFPQCEDQAEAEVVSLAFELLTVNIVRHVPDFISTSLINTYITDDKSTKLVQLLERISSKEIERFNKEIDSKHQSALLTYISQILHTELTPQSVNVLKQIRIFKEIRSIGDDRFDLVSINDNCTVCRGHDFPVRFYKSMILICSDTELNLAKKLGAEILGAEQLTMKTLQNASYYTPVEIQSLILWLLKQPEMMTNREITEIAKRIKFLQSEDGQWKQPSTLFDPKDELISKLFKHEGVFPKIPMKDETLILQGLSHLGLKTRADIKRMDIMRTCQIIDRNSKEYSSVNEEKAEALLEFLNGNPELIDKTLLWDKHIIPIKAVEPDNYPDSIIYKTNRCGYIRCLPSEVKSSKYLHLIGSVYFTFDCTSVQNVADNLGWTQPPSVTDVIRHFQNVIDNYSVKNRTSCIQIISKVYEWLADRRQQRHKIVTNLRQNFQKPNDQFIWNGDGFVSPDDIYIDSLEESYEELHPFMSKLPTELQHLSEFFSDLGCVRCPNSDMFVKALGRIKRATESQYRNKSKTSLRKMAITILNKVKDDYIHEVQTSDLFCPVYQNSSSDVVMKSVKECVYCEAGEFDNSFALAQDIVPIHPDVPIQTAKAIGVQNITRKMLSESDFFESWGQEEPLAIRIRNIITHGYEDGFAVIKELFQNAEDAGASKFYIMYDERENNEAKTSLISGRMSECQGPAFWVYNDALFSEQDLVNIRKLGYGTKHNDAGKIGEFGHGFCAVYNITDVPSILSGSNLIIFDPQTTFLKETLPQGSPGIRIDLRKEGNTEVIRTFSDQFKPYENVFGCKLSDNYLNFPGTLLRLPLRTNESQISDTIYSKSTAKQLMNSIINLSSNLFYFNQSAELMRLYHLHKSASDPSDAKLVFEVATHKQDVPVAPNKHQRISVINEVCKRKTTKTLEDKPLKQLQEVKISTKLWYEIDEIECSSVTWLVSWATGTDADLLSCSYNNQTFLPLGAIAVPVETCSQNPAENMDMKYKVIDFEKLPRYFYKTGHYFCILPTPHNHQFRFHINGKFHLSLDRKRLKVKSDEVHGTHETKWNEMIMGDPVVSSFLFLLEGTVIPQMEAFHLWPREDDDDNTLNNCLVERFYASVTSRTNTRAFEHDGSVVSLSQCIFLDPDLRDDILIGESVFSVLDSHSGKCAIDIPRDIYTLLQDSNDSLIKHHIVTPELFLVCYFFPVLDCLSVKISEAERNRILKYAIYQDIESVKRWLETNKCIPSDDGSLKETTQIVDPRSKLANLFLQSEGYFPETGFVDESVNEKLKTLGMRTDELSDDMLLNRVRTITTEKITCRGCAIDRSLYLISYLCENSDRHEKIFQELKEFQFLPVMSKPENWPFMWHADNAMFRSKRLPHTTGCKEHKTLDTRLVLERPGNLYICEFIELVACNHLIVDKSFCDKLAMQERVHEKKLKSLFCQLGMHGLINKEQYVQEVVSQLTTVQEYYDDSPRDIDIKDATERICKKVYDFLEEFSNSYHVKSLTNKSIIWIKDRFVSPQNVSHDSALDGCQPYLYNVKESPISRCPELCLSLQIQEHFYAKGVAEILEKIAIGRKHSPCNEAQINAVVNLLHLFHKCLEREETSDLKQILIKEGVSAIYAPDENSILRDCSTLCLNDSNEIEKTATMMYVHERVPLSLAKSLNIKSKTLHRLEETTEDVEDFYQNEPLCSRLRRIVDGLPFDAGMFKELLQNADDAKATEVVFIKDFTSYPTDNIPGETFKPLQGPALCVYNNSGFSKEDLIGITLLGEGSKSNDPSTTGKYGVGFNAVYNITDAPSFYTTGEELENGETLCIFDPLARFVPNVSRDKPGKRFKDVQWIRQNHADLLKGYHEKMFPSLRQKGTMFRFPLRSEPSDIKHEVIDLSKLSVILKTFCDELKYSMIFLKYLKTVRVYTLDSGKYTEEYAIETNLSATDLWRRNQFATAQSEMYRAFRNQRREVFDIRQETVDYKIILRETSIDRCSSSSYHVIQTIGFDKTIEIPKLVKEGYDKGKIGLLPQGGIAVFERKGKTSNFGKAFCFLPLPVDTGLPVHVNGDFTLDHETRRSLWKSEYIDSCYRTQWNLAVLNHVIARSYIIYLQKLHSILFESFSNEYVPHTVIKSALCCFFSHFPLYECASDMYWKELTRKVYSCISTEQLPFMPVLEENLETVLKSCIQTFRLSWIPMTLKDHDHYIIYDHFEARATSNEPSLNTVLRAIGMKITSVPKDIRDTFEKCGKEIESLSPRHVIDYLCTFDKEEVARPKEFLSLRVNQTNFQNESNLKNVFDYCLQDTKHFFKNLQSLPIILTQDGVLRRLSASHTVFVTDFSKFFPGRLDQFIHKSLVHRLNCISVEESDQDENKDFTQLSGGYMKRFTITEFVALTSTEGLFGMHEQTNDPWDQINPSKKLISTFWNFFHKQQCPDYNQTTVSQCLEGINALHLIPSIDPISDKKVLLTASDIDILIDLDSFQRGTKLYKVIKLFALTELDKSAFDREQQGKRNDLPLDLHSGHEQQIETRGITDSSYKILLEQVPKFDEPEKCIRCLVRNIFKIKRAPLGVADVGLLLKYLSDRATLLRNKDDLASLKKVPVFVTHCGDIKSVDNYDRVVVVPKDLPKSGLNLITIASNVILLRDLDVTDLFNILDFAQMPVGTVYTELIFPNQHHLTRHQFYDHVDYLCRYVLFEKTTENEMVLYALKELQFLEIEPNVCVHIKDTFYDRHPRKEFFRLFCNDNEMLPRVFHKSHIISVFERLGLQCDMNIELFVRFANEISFAKRLNDEHVRQKSKLLVDRLFKMGARFYQRNNFMEFSLIPFIIPDNTHKILSVIHKPFNSSQMFCFAGSVRDETVYTCWTTANILPEWADPVQHNADDLVRKLGICLQPNISLVITHFEQLGRKLNENVHLMVDYRRLVTKAMENIYKAMNESSNCRDQISILKDVPIIHFPQRNTIEVASSVVIDCSAGEEIVPYLQKSPTEYGQFENLFLQLGCQREPSVGKYAAVIKAIRHEFRGQEISATQREAILKAMLNIVMQVRKMAPQLPLKLDSLYFLSDENVLTDARHLVIDNNRYLHNRLKGGIKLSYMVNLEEFASNTLQMDEIIDCLRKIDKTSRPSLLTEIVKEEVDMSQVSHIDSDLATNVEQFIHSQLFVTSVCRLARHGVRNKLQKQWSDEKEKDLSSWILKVGLKHVKGIRTNLLLNNEAIDNTCESKQVHIQATDNDKTVVYFDTTDNGDWYAEVTNAIILHLREIHGCLVDEVLFTAQKIFMCRKPELCEELLDRDGIEAYKSTSAPRDINELADREVEETEREPYHWYAEAERWHRQANRDIEHAHESLKAVTGGTYNWVCYQAHQAAEKSLKAALFAKDANKMELMRESHCLVSIAQELTSELRSYAQSLSDVTGWHTRMRYPNAVTSPRIPSDCYSRAEAESVVKIAEDILHEVQTIILSRD